jgi:8-hydroxy-5-deazaflavin:NADPH oxidoreductase
MGQSVSIVGGTGALGFGLGVRFARAGIPIIIGSRDAARAGDAATRAADLVPGGSFIGTANPDAVREAKIVILSVPFRSQAETLKALKDVLHEPQILVDATVPLATAINGRPTHTVGVWHGSAAQQAQAIVPTNVRVVSAFHTVSAALLSDLEHDLAEDVLVCGDHASDKKEVIDLLEQVPGLRGVDCGPLEMARIVEQLTPLLISINMRLKVRAGIKITGLHAG